MKPKVERDLDPYIRALRAAGAPKAEMDWGSTKRKGRGRLVRLIHEYCTVELEHNLSTLPSRRGARSDAPLRHRTVSSSRSRVIGAWSNCGGTGDPWSNCGGSCGTWSNCGGAAAGSQGACKVSTESELMRSETMTAVVESERFGSGNVVDVASGNVSTLSGEHGS